MTIALPHYGNPPLNEVVLGVTFEPLSDLKAPHTGLFWSLIQDKFPRCEHAPIIGDFAAIAEPLTGLPLPRLWFINQVDDLLVQLQKNKFLFNWRKKSDAYPRYDNVSKQFFDLLSRFRSFVSDHDLGVIKPHEFEVSYINLIPQGEGWVQLEDISNLIPGLCCVQKTRFLSRMTGVLQQAIFDMPDQLGQVVMKLQSGLRLPDQHPVLTLEITARGYKPNSPSFETMHDWFDRAHVSIVCSFEDVTSETVQREIWRKT